MENKEFEKYLNNIEFDDKPDYQHRDKLEKEILASLERKSGECNKTKSIVDNKIIKYSIAAMLAIALLIPLTYGANNIIKRLFAGPVGYDDYKGDFALDKDIRVELKVGNKKKQDIVKAYNIRFFVEDGELRGTLRLGLNCIPKFKWMTKIELFDSKNTNLVSTEHVNENTGAATSYDSSFPYAIHFTLGKTGDISDVQNFIIIMKEASDKIKTTPDAWYESDKLTIVRGRVTDHNGEPIAGAKVQIREKRKPGQDGIAAPDVITDENGFYSFDQIDWEYTVSVLIYEPLLDGEGLRHYFKGLNQTFEESKIVDFKIEEFPTGDAVVFGTMEAPNGEPIKEFSVDIRSHVDWNNRTDQYTYQFGYKKPFVTQDGSFEIDNLPAGTFNVLLFPTKEEIMTEEDFVNRKEYSFEIQNGQKIEITSINDNEKLYYGRVLFEDGSPAVPELSEYKTQLIYCSKDSQSGEAIATVGDDGYFAVLMSNEKVEQLESGEASLQLCVEKPRSFETIRGGQLFPFELLSPKRDNAGTMTIKRPTVYYGRILYDNGKSAIPEVIPWELARERTIRASLVYKPATSRNPGLEKGLCFIDNEGYLSAYLTDDEIEKLKSGDFEIRISYPSYELQNNLYSIYYPFEKLSKEKANVEGYNILTDKSMGYENLPEVLNSINKLKVLSAALDSYAQKNTKNYPEIMGFADIQTEDLQWLTENVEYFPVMKSQDISKSAKTVIAYDKTLLEKYDATLVLFRDGHIEYCWPRELEILGIKKLETSITQ